MFGNSEFGEAIKVGAQDDVVLVDSSHRPWCRSILKHLGKYPVDSDSKIFQPTLAQYEQLFRDFSKQSGLKPGLFTPHVLRHSGPSFDLINKYCDIDTIQSRGRRASAQSAARYSKPGRLLMTAAKLPVKFRAYTEVPLHSAPQQILNFSWALPRAP